MQFWFMDFKTFNTISTKKLSKYINLMSHNKLYKFYSTIFCDFIIKESLSTKVSFNFLVKESEWYPCLWEEMQEFCKFNKI